MLKITEEWCFQKGRCPVLTVGDYIPNSDLLKVIYYCEFKHTVSAPKGIYVSASSSHMVTLDCINFLCTEGKAAFL